MAPRRSLTRPARLGPLTIGGGAPVVVQTMGNADPLDPEAILAQIGRLTARGAELVRLAVPNEAAARVLAEVTPHSPVPLVADVHFDWRLALWSLKAKAAGLRLNPGNIRDPEKIKKVAEAAMANGAAIRVGVNAGSLDPEVLARYGHTPEAMVQSALKEIAVLEAVGFTNIVVSLKASEVRLTVEAARLMARRSDYPQHLGVTEAGDLESGVVKSAVGLGLLLYEGLGDTIRVSLTGPPEAEVDCAYEILKSLGLRVRGPEYISCPTCGRCRIDLAALLRDVKERLSDLKTPLKIAVMGCEVNGPGEAKRADLGVAGGQRKGVVFEKGLVVGQYPFESLAAVLEDKARVLAGEPKTIP